MCRNLGANTGYDLLSKERKANVYTSISSSRAGLKKSKSFLSCCFCITTSSFNPSLQECVSHLCREFPGIQNFQNISRLRMVRNQLITSLPSNHTHLEREGKTLNGYWVENRACKIQKELKTHLISRAQTAIISTQTCIEERDTKVSHLQTGEDWKSRKIFFLQRGITEKTTQHRNILYLSTFFLNIYAKQEIARMISKLSFFQG